MAIYTIFGIVAVIAIAAGIIAKFNKFNFSTIAHRCFLPVALTLVCSIPCPALAAKGHGVTVSAAPGTLVRWSAPGTKRCGMNGRSWPALEETCYYPVDLLHKPGLIKITRWGHGPGESAHISVEPYPYETEEIDLGDIPQANPSPKDLKRDAREQALLNKIWKRKEGPAKFTLPLGAPAIRCPRARPSARSGSSTASRPRIPTPGPTTPRRRTRRSWPSPTERWWSPRTCSSRATPCSSTMATALSACPSTSPRSRSRRGSRSRRAKRSAWSARRAAPPGRICSSASAGTAPASTPSSCLRTRPRSRPWASEHWGW